LYEHRGETLLPFLTYTFPCFLSAAINYVVGGDVDLGYQIGSFIGIFLIVFCLYYFLQDLSGNILCKIFIVFFMLFFSFLSLRDPTLLPLIIKALPGRPHPVNDFFRQHNIQYSFVFYAWMLSAFCMLLKRPQSVMRAIILGISLSVSVYTYYYYGLQAAAMMILLYAYTLCLRDWPSFKALFLAGVVALIFLIPFFYGAYDFVNSGIFSDYLQRLAVNRQGDFFEKGLMIIAVSILYLIASKKISPQEGHWARTLLSFNALAVGLMIVLFSLFQINVQTCHLISRAFYPVMGLLIADFLAIVIKAISKGIGAIFPNQKAASIVSYVANGFFVTVSILLVFFHVYLLHNLVQKNNGYYTLDKGLVKVIEWVKENRVYSDVFLTSDPEIIHLLPAYTKAWTFLTVANTTVARNKELMDRIAWGYAMLGITEDELAERMDRLKHSKRNFDRAKWKKISLDYDEFGYAYWGYTHFGRTFESRNMGLAKLITPQDGEIGQKVIKNKISEYIPIQIRNKLSSLLRKYQASDLSECPYRVTHIISTPFDRMGGSSLEKGLFQNRLKFLLDFHGYRIYKITSPAR
jgi:hypothetical protein